MHAFALRSCSPLALAALLALASIGCGPQADARSLVVVRDEAPTQPSAPARSSAPVEVPSAVETANMLRVISTMYLQFVQATAIIFSLVCR